jgi:hypothetical protein
MFDSQMKDSIWNHNPAKFLKECKRLRALCQRIIDGEESVIEGSRKMVTYRFWMKEEGNIGWSIFTGVSSESDHLPLGAVRRHWAADALKQKDERIMKLENFYRENVIEAARRIRDQYQEYVERGAPPDEQC